MSGVYKAAYVNIMKREVTKLSREKCYGCQLDHPSRVQHQNLSTGCLLPFLELLETHGADAFNFVKKSEVAVLAKEVGLEYECDDYEQFPQSDCREIMELLKRDPDLMKKLYLKMLIFTCV